ncbi:MAG: hypothetical protein ACP6IU_14670 [Candidatus Asgardarchaeia archaeon]
MSDIKEELLRDKDFIKGIVTEIARDKSMRALLLQSVIKEVATKDDLRDLKEYIDARINDIYRYIGTLESSINARIDSLDKRITTLESSMNARIDGLRWMMMIFFTVFSIILSILTFFVSTLISQ